MEQEIMENKQSYMMDNNSIQHLTVASVGDGVVGVVQAEVVSGVADEILGGKYDEQNEEHDVGDDDELKYAEEVQQSEKQQQQLQNLKNFGLGDDDTRESSELVEKEGIKSAGLEFGNGNGDFVFGGIHQIHPQQQRHDLFNIKNGHDTNRHDDANFHEGYGSLISTGFEEKLDVMESEIDGFKNEGDFSSTSNATESLDGFVPQIDVKVESKVENQEIVDEDEPSSLATNTTNGTSSLSENVLPSAAIAPQANTFDNFVEDLKDKELDDNLTRHRPIELDLDQSYSQLNPDAKEFIPSFGSNPASPTSPFATGLPQTEPVLSEIMETEMYFGQAPSAVSRHLLVDDDFVAQSPCKGKGVNNMDAVPLPRALSEFEQEADKRPHEPEGVDDFNQRLDDIETLDKENQPPADSTDFQTSNFIDHGPETCVDVEADLVVQPINLLSTLQGQDDVMKRSMYVASDDAIEDVLNSVQPIPTEIDGIKYSFSDDSTTKFTTNQFAVDKELLQIEEKEHVSHSPSTEEFQMNLQNTIDCSNKDIPLPVDMDNANNMEESMYMEQEQQVQPSPEQDQELHFHDQNQNPDKEPSHKFIELEHDENSITATPPVEVAEENVLVDTTNSIFVNVSFLENSLDAKDQPFAPLKPFDNAIESLNFDAPVKQQEPNLNDVVITTPVSADEKHLLEETKEQQLFSISGLEQQMNEMMLNNDDDHLPQAEEVGGATATTAIEDISENLIAQDGEYQVRQQQENTQEQLFVDDSFVQHEQECLEQHLQNLQHEREIVIEDNQQAETKPDLVHEFIETPIEQQYQQELESEMVLIEKPINEANEAAPLFTDEETESIIINTTEEKEELKITMITQDETEIVKNDQTTDEIKAESSNEFETPAKAEYFVKKEVFGASDVPLTAAIITAVAAVATGTAVAAKVASSPNKNEIETTKISANNTATAAKPKVASAPAAKKPIEAGKKPIGFAAKPRVASAKSACTVADNKPIGKTNITASSTAARKPSTATTSAATKAMAKTTTVNSTTRMVTSTSKTSTTSKPTTTPRTLPLSTTATRKPAPTNGPLPKPRPATAPTKPTTLGIPATNGAPKTKPTSPRATLTSQARKITPATTLGKSPVKPTTTNSVTKSASSTLASRTKTTTSTVSSTAGITSKPFTARPAPKFTSSSNTTTTTMTAKRSTVGSSTTASATTTKTSSPMRRSSPTKPATGKTTSKTTPTSAGLKSKAPISKQTSPSAKPAPIRKPVDITAAVTNGEVNPNKELNGTAEKIATSAQLEQQQNGDSSIPNQTEEQQSPFLEPMDLINA